jgi:hypothetical protein
MLKLLILKLEVTNKSKVYLILFGKLLNSLTESNFALFYNLDTFEDVLVFFFLCSFEF